MSEPMPNSVWGLTVVPGTSSWSWECYRCGASDSGIGQATDHACPLLAGPIVAALHRAVPSEPIGHLLMGAQGEPEVMRGRLVRLLAESGQPAVDTDGNPLYTFEPDDA